MLGRTEEGLLTADGYERLGIRYRSSAVDELLSNMSGTAAVRSQRKDGSWTVRIKARISPGNLSSVQIYDTLIEDWVDLPSTQPQYTHLLSEWEHREFSRHAKKRNEAFNSQDQRMASRARTIRAIDKLAPKMKFQQRRDMAALSQSLQVKLLSNGQPALPPVTSCDAIISSQTSFDTSRLNEGYPIKLPAKGDRGHKPQEAPPRADDYGAPEPDIDWNAPDLFDADDLEPDQELQADEDDSDDEEESKGEDDSHDPYESDEEGE